MPTDPSTPPQTLPALTEAPLAPLTRPAERFTRAQQALFLELLSEWGNVRAAARAAGVSRQHAYRVRRACPDFARLWDAARLAAVPRVEDVLADRALNGVEEAVFYHGEEVAVKRRYDARLLLAHMARLDRLTLNPLVRDSVETFEEQLEALENLSEIEWVSVPVEGARVETEDAPGELDGGVERDMGGGDPFSD